MVASDKMFGKRQYVIWGEKQCCSEKPVYASGYSLFETPSTENYFKQFAANFLQQPTCKKG